MYLCSKRITGFDGLVCGSLSGNWGQLEFERGSEDKLVISNREKYFKKLGISLADTVFQKQTHSINLRLAGDRDKGRGAYSVKNVLEDNDALVSNSKNLFLCSFTADCVPVSFFDPKTYSFGIAHAGWRGVLGLIAQKAAQELNKSFKVNYSDLIYYLGPSIGSCCYEVGRAGDKRALKFVNQFGPEIITKKGKKIYLDLNKAIIKQLQEIGVSKKNIEISGICTCCNKEYDLPSYYREKKNLEGSILSVIGINKK